MAIVLGACADNTQGVWDPPAPSEQGTPMAAVDDGITLSSWSAERLTGVYVDPKGTSTITFDLAKVGDDIFADVKGIGGRPIVKIETTATDYLFTYMDGSLTLRTSKTFVAQARAMAQTNPEGVSTDGFAFTGDTNVLDDMLKLPEVAKLPELSRALGVRGFTGNLYPSSFVLHKMARQSADALGISVAKLDVPITENGYCQAYPNEWNQCYGMCGPGCSCWSWVCGNCCYHHGCAVHDSWCREGKWWWCYNISAVIALFGC